MSVKFFGQYLLEKNIIKPEALLEAVKLQETENRIFGQYAIAKGYLTEDDIQRLHKEQQHNDMRFGEIAVKLGLLTHEQVEEILSIQRQHHIFIGEALVAKGFISREVMERELSLFIKEQSRYFTGEIDVPDGIQHPELVRDMVDMTQKMFHRMMRLNVKVGDGHIDSREPDINSVVVKVTFSGNPSYEYILSSPMEISRLIASSQIGNNAIEDHNMIVDSVKEFCNIVCGNIISKFSLKGKKLDISPPLEITKSDEGYKVIKARKAIQYPLIFPEGQCSLILVEC
jgi:CheY-specific phosphatase CheX